MGTVRPFLAAALGLVLIAPACADDPTNGPPSPQGPATIPATVTDSASLVAALEAAGFSVREGDVEARDDMFFGVPRRSLLVGEHEVWLYEFDSSDALEEITSAITPDGFGVPTRRGGVAQVEWIAPPHFFAGERLLVLYLGDDGDTLDALELVLGPQFAGSDQARAT